MSIYTGKSIKTTDADYKASQDKYGRNSATNLLAEALKRKVTKHADPEVQKKKEEWFRKHVVIMKA